MGECQLKKRGQTWDLFVGMAPESQWDILITPFLPYLCYIASLSVIL